LHKHVRYAELEAQRRGRARTWRHRLHALRVRDDSRPLPRAILKDIVFPSVPVKPVALFAYMYVIRLGVLDGLAGLRFCFLHAFYQATVGALQAEAAANRQDLAALTDTTSGSGEGQLATHLD
jgi:hypothetical protein